MAIILHKLVSYWGFPPEMKGLIMYIGFKESLFAIYTITSIYGCGLIEKKSHKKQPDGFYDAPTSEIAEKLFDEAKVTCEDLGQCNPSVGLLVARHDTSVGVCTSFLVAKDTVLTNSHCLPEQMKEGDSCQGIIGVLFPKTITLDEMRTTCKVVTRRSKHTIEGTIASQDFAVLKLSKELPRPILSISTKKSSEGEALSVVSMTPTSRSSPMGQIGKPKTCPVLGRNLLSPRSEETNKPIIFMAECGLVEGNSGSPILDSTGFVRAIGQGSLKRDKVYQDLMSIMLEELSQMDVATGFSCISPETYTTVETSECKDFPKLGDATIYTQNELSENSALGKALAEKIDQATNEWNRYGNVKAVESGVSSFTWKPTTIKEDSSSTKIVPVPSCFRPPATWLDAKVKRGLFGYPSSFTEYYDFSEYKIKVGLNKFLQLDSRLEKIYFTFPLEITFNPKQLNSDGPSPQKTPPKIPVVLA
ncbi:MAG: serine protease, partial [Pseudomonadota bacterium]